MDSSIELPMLYYLLTSLCILIPPLYIIYKPPNFVIRYFQRRWPDVLWQIPTASKVIALTLDDGPSDHTREILKILQTYDAHATFFITGSQVPGREDILREIVRAGNELGNHAMHDEPSRSLSDTTLAKEIEAVDGMLSKAYDAVAGPDQRPPRYFRPGHGFFSDRMRELLKRMGYRLILGGIYPHDPQIPFWWMNANHILSMIRPGGIIICHDGRAWTLPMLRKILPEMQRQGYRIVTITELLKETI
ncbi:MAG: hypothetical protein Q9227_001013 [Pyrenula ochraceoflavens]